MSLSWINLTSSLTNGIKTINSIESAKFPLLLSRIFTSIQTNSEPFSREELQKLKKSLHLSTEELKLLLDTLIQITKQSQCFLMKPTVLEDELVEQLHLNADKAAAFVKCWTETTKFEFGDLRNMKKVQNISWELNLEMMSDSDLKKTIPVSLLQFQIKDNENKTENITVELNEVKLLELYEEIETIQSYLDNIN